MLNSDGTVAGTGMTPADLQAAGYSVSDILTMDPTAFDTPTAGTTASPIGPLPAASPPSGSGGLLSGLTAVGTAFTNVFRAINPPAAGTRLINPATGLPYTTAQLAGTSGSLLPLLLLALAAWFFLRAK